MTRPAPRRRPVALDLFAGTGNATAAFRTAGWQVVTVDLVRATCPDVVADARALPFKADWAVDVLWASPPCHEFSEAHPRRWDPAFRPSLDLVVASLAAVRDYRPRYWVLENVRGAIRFLGVPVQKIGPWCLWGYFPPLRVTLPMHTHRKSGARTARDRAAIPPAVSVALLDAVRRYWNAPSLLDLRPFRRHRHRAQRHPSPEALGDLFRQG